ncbi:hypothetical protein VZT92_020278 [Zoarces viviparus]
MQRSRRLLLVLSPNLLAEKSFSLLECRLGLYLQRSHRASAAIVAVVYRSISKLPWVEAAQIRQVAEATVTWRGTRSEPRRSRFWLRLRLALPGRPLAMGRRLIDSTSSHSDLAALALQRVQRNQDQKDTDNQSRRNRLAPSRGRGWEGWSQHSTGCSGCAGFTAQVQDRGAGLTVKTEMQQVSQDIRTEIQSDPVPETEPTTMPDSTHDPGSAFTPAPDSALPTCHRVIGSRTSE